MTYEEIRKQVRQEFRTMFKEVIAGDGNCKLEKEDLERIVTNISSEPKGTLIETIKIKDISYDIYLKEGFDTYCYIKHNDDIVCINHLLHIGSKTIKGKVNTKSFNNVLMESLIITSKDYRKLGLASITYETLLKLGYDIMSSNKQYDGTRKIWKSLSHKYTVDVFDDNIEEFMYYNATIKSTSINHLDKTIWSLYPDMSCNNIYMIVSNL